MKALDLQPQPLTTGMLNSSNVQRLAAPACSIRGYSVQSVYQWQTAPQRDRISIPNWAICSRILCACLLNVCESVDQEDVLPIS